MNQLKEFKNPRPKPRSMDIRGPDLAPEQAVSTGPRSGATRHFMFYVAANFDAAAHVLDKFVRVRLSRQVQPSMHEYFARKSQPPK